jgi:hypothetical protein
MGKKFIQTKNMMNIIVVIMDISCFLNLKHIYNHYYNCFYEHFIPNVLSIQI